MPLVIVDGPEASGKSTIIEALLQTWGPNSSQRSWGPRDSWLEYCQPLFEDTQACKENPQFLIVWSRSWISRAVYNKLLLQGQNVPMKATTELDNIVISSGGLLILVTSPISVLKERRQARLREGNEKPDHPLDPRKEQNEFVLQTHRRRWLQMSGIVPPEDNVRTILDLLVSRNAECRMVPPSALDLSGSPWHDEVRIGEPSALDPSNSSWNDEVVKGLGSL